MRDDRIIRIVAVLEHLARASKSEPPGITVVVLQEKLAELDVKCVKRQIYNYITALMYAGTRLGFRIEKSGPRYWLERS